MSAIMYNFLVNRFGAVTSRWYSNSSQQEPCTSMVENTAHEHQV